MVSALVSKSSGTSWSYGQGHRVVFWARHFTFTVSLSIQVYKWTPANLGGVGGGRVTLD